MNIFFEFLVRLIAGMTATMGVIPTRHVSSGFFRNHLYVVLGLATLACLVAVSLERALLWWTVPLVLLAYAGAIAWLYEAKVTGKWLLGILCAVALVLASRRTVAVLPGMLESPLAGQLLNVANVATSSWLMGAVLISMLLGHWYLNAPEMEISPLEGLLRFSYAALAGRLLVCGGGLIWQAGGVSTSGTVVGWLLLLRWLFGFCGLAGVLWMAWQTLKIPNTQSATGLLYIAVFAVLAGELVSLLLSAQHAFAL